MGIWNACIQSYIITKPWPNLYEQGAHNTESFLSLLQALTALALSLKLKKEPYTPNPDPFEEIHALY